MTGIYLRVLRQGKWQALEIEYLTEEELNTVFKDSDKRRVIAFLAGVCKRLREVEQA